MKRLAFLAAGMFVMGCHNYVIAGLLPGISSTLGASFAAAGQGSAAFGATYAISAPTLAVLLAKKSARLVLVIALSVFAIGNLLTLLSTELAAYIASRAIAGIGAGLYTPVAVAAATHLAEPGARGRALSVVWGSNSAGAVIGVPAGLWLAGEVGWRTPVGMILILDLIALLGIATWQKDLRVTAPPSLAKRVRLLADRRLLSVIGVTLIATTGSLGLYTYVAPMQSGAASSLASALGTWSVGGLIGSATIGSVLDRTGQPRRVMAAVLAALTVAVSALPALRSVSVLDLLPYFLWGALGWATLAPQQHTLIRLQPGQGATLAALNGSAVSLGGVLGSTLGGLAMAGGLEARNLPYAAAGLLFCALVWQLSLIKRFPGEVPA